MQRLSFVFALALGFMFSTPVAFAHTLTVDSGVLLSPPSGLDAQMLVTRATFTKMVVDRLYSPEEIDHCYWDIASTTPPTFTLLYTDVPVTAPFGHEICIALRDGLAHGYSDGSFHPDQLINFADASKIISRAYVLSPYAETETRSPWFAPYAFAMSTRNAIPESVTTFQHMMTAGETEEILERLSGGITWRTATSYDQLIQSSYPHHAVQLPPRAPAMSSSRPSTGSVMSEATIEQSSSSPAPWYKFY